MKSSFALRGKLESPLKIPAMSFETSLSQIHGEEKKMFINFVKRMLTWDPRHRSTAKELLDDPWLDMRKSN